MNEQTTLAYYQRQFCIAVNLFFLGKQLNLTGHEINVAVKTAFSQLDYGISGASAYETGAKTLKIIVLSHEKPKTLMQ